VSGFVDVVFAAVFGASQEVALWRKNASRGDAKHAEKRFQSFNHVIVTFHNLNSRLFNLKLR
jgi:hypothetical protein